MPFRFSLTTVLQVRENLEQKEARALEQCYVELSAAQGRLWEAEQNITHAQEERAHELSQGIPAYQLQLALGDEKRLKQLRENWQTKLQEAQVRLRGQIEIYKRARQQRETMEELRKQQVEEYQREQLKSEQQERDELYLMRLRSGK
jgi:flagellar export protein FliJ